MARAGSRASGPANANVSLIPYRLGPSGEDVRYTADILDNYYITQSTCRVNGAGYIFTTGDALFLTDAAFSGDWKRFECSFVVPPDAIAADVLLRPLNVLVDAVQVEEGEYATDFVDGVNQQLQVIHMKVAPEEFACKGESTDHAICAKFAGVCRQEEAGCQAYTDLATPTVCEVPAILSANDSCPAQCVGYAEYRKSASAFDLVEYGRAF